MRVFKITGKFQQNGRYSDLKEDFKGFFVMEANSQEIKGYMEEQYKSRYDPIKCIHGLYDETENKLVYLKLAKEKELSQLLYIFPNLNKEGVWTAFKPMYGGFFAFGNADGLARATIEEITENVDEFSQKVLEKYEQVHNIGLELEIAVIQYGDDPYKNLSID